MTIFDIIFDDAKIKSELDFCLSLLRIKGSGHNIDQLYESNQFINMFGSLQNMTNNHIRLRLLLSLYCHITEMNDLYYVPMNMLRIIDGNEYSISPFYQNIKKEPVYSSQKIPLLIDLANKLNYTNLANNYEFMFESKIRNAFYHSDYSIRNKEFIIHNGKGVKINNIITKNVPLSWLIPKIQAALDMIYEFLNLLEASREKYTHGITIWIKQ